MWSPAATGRARSRCSTARFPDERLDQLMRDELGRGLGLQKLAQTAHALGHEPIGWLRSDDEYISACSRCGARIYARLGAHTVKDGEALTNPCP